MTHTTYAEQTRVEIYEPELEPDETLQPQAVALAQGIGSQLVPISFEVIGANSKHFMHNQYAYAAHVLFDTMDPDFISITEAAPDEYNPNDYLDTAAEHGDKSKIVPIVSHIHTSMPEEQSAIYDQVYKYHKWGIEKVLVHPTLVEFGGEKGLGQNTAQSIQLIREVGHLSSVGVVVAATTSHSERGYDQIAEELGAADFGVTQFMLNPKPYIELTRAMRARAINTPIIPGVKPFKTYSAIEATANYSGVSTTDIEELKSSIIHRPLIKHQPALISYFINMSCDLIKQHDAPGLHIYTDNNVRIAQRLAQGVEQAVANS